MDILAQAVQLIGKGLKQSLIALEAGIGICTSLGGCGCMAVAVGCR